MTRYTVTLELETPLWKRLLRRFNLIPQRKEFEILTSFSGYEIADIIANGISKIPVKIVDIHEQ